MQPSLSRQLKRRMQLVCNNCLPIARLPTCVTGMVELLIRAGVREWQEDKQHRKPLQYARGGVAEDKAQLIEHQHSMPIHQATVNNDVSMMQLLIRHGARLDVCDTMWNGTPLGWAIHTGQREAEKYLRSILTRDSEPQQSPTA